MLLSVDITRKDYAAFNKFHFVKTQLARTAIIILVVIVVLQFFLNRDHLDWISTIVSSVACVVMYAFIIHRSLKKTANIPDENGTILGPKELEFTEDKIYCKAQNFQGTYDWSSVKSLEESKTAFYLYMDANMAILLPKRFFKGDAQIQHFKDFVASKTLEN